MINRLLFRLTLEIKKLSWGLYLLVAIGIPFGVFLVTTAFLLLNAERMASLPLEVMISNNLGAWSSLLYPLVLIVLIQNLVEVETKSNLLVFSKSYQKGWFKLFLWKAMVVTLTLILITGFNLLFHVGLAEMGKNYMDSNSDPSEVIAQGSMVFLKLIPTLIPTIFFHLMVCFTIQKNGFAYLIGIMLTIIGIPLANLTHLAVIPYSFGIVLRDPNGKVEPLVLVSLLLLLLSPFVTNWALKRVNNRI
ncbi:MAG: hypothetical protein ACFB10_07675 [Salibacteraceae bacterium]